MRIWLNIEVLRKGNDDEAIAEAAEAGRDVTRIVSRKSVLALVNRGPQVDGSDFHQRSPHSLLAALIKTLESSRWTRIEGIFQKSACERIDKRSAADYEQLRASFQRLGMPYVIDPGAEVHREVVLLHDQTLLHLRLE